MKCCNVNTLSILLLLLTSGLFLSCSSSQSTVQSPDQTTTVASAQDRVVQVPDWYLNPPTDDSEFLYSIGTATSTRMNLAQSRAELDAKTSLSSKLGEKIEALQKLFEEEIDVDEATNFSAAFTAASRLVTGQDLRGVSIRTQEFQTTVEGRYISFILLQLPVGKARDQLEQALSRDEEMYVRFKESRAFEELERNLERLGMDD